jgi:hypothetical protein
MDRAEFRIRAEALDAQLLRLACQYEDLLADLRGAVGAGNAHLDPDGMLDERLDRVCFQLFTTGSVFARVDAEPEAPEGDTARWWHADISERTFMNLRHWLDRCLRDGLLELELREFPPGIRETAGDGLLSASDGRRSVECVLRPTEQTWLLAHWPAQLREAGPPHSATRGRLA